MRLVFTTQQKPFTLSETTTRVQFIVGTFCGLFLAGKKMKKKFWSYFFVSFKTFRARIFLTNFFYFCLLIFFGSGFFFWLIYSVLGILICLTLVGIPFGLQVIFLLISKNIFFQCFSNFSPVLNFVLRFFLNFFVPSF